MNSHGTLGTVARIALLTILGATLCVGPCAAQCANWAVGFGYPGNGLPNPVNALATFDEGSGERLFAGGGFPDWNWGVARWDGASWTQVGNGPDLNTSVVALATYDGGTGPALYAAGGFNAIGGVSANRVAKWNGSAWSGLGPGLNSLVSTLVAFDDGTGMKLYAGGAFTLAGPTSVNHIARWNGTAWAPVGTGLNGSVLATCIFDDGAGPKLYATGNFPGGLSKWNGTSWSTVGGGVTQGSTTMTVYNDGSGSGLYVGGVLQVGGQSTQRLARWNGTTWQTFAVGPDAGVFSLHAFDDSTGNALYVGGSFSHIGATPYACIAKWNGVNWSAVGGGINTGGFNRVQCFVDRVEGNGPRLYVAGEFALAGATPSSNIARWGDACSVPVITLQPQNTTAVVNNAFSPITLTVSAVGNAPLSYQWRKNNVALVNDTRILGATTATLKILFWNLNDAGNYDVVVTNSQGSTTSNLVTVTVPTGTNTGLPLQLTPLLLTPEPVDNLAAGHNFTSIQTWIPTSSSDLALIGQVQGPSVNKFGIGTSIGGSTELVNYASEQAPGCEAGAVFSTSANQFNIFVPTSGGRLCFASDLSGPSITSFNKRGMWFHDTSGTVLVAREGSALPGLPVGYQLRTFLWPQLSATGTAVFGSYYYDAGNVYQGEGIWSWDTTTGASLVLKTGMTGPGTTGTIVDFGSPDTVSINDAGQIALIAGMSPPAAALWTGYPNALQLLAQTGDPAPGFGPNVLLYGFYPWALNNAGELLVSASVTGPAGFSARAVYRSNQGALVPVALRGDNAPGIPIATTFVTPLEARAFNSAGDGVFYAGVNGPCGTCPTWGLWFHRNGVNTLIVANRMDPLPGAPPGYDLSEINEVAINASGQVAFNCKLYAGGDLWSVYGWTLERGLFPIAVAGMQVETAPGQFQTIRSAALATTVGGVTGLRTSRSFFDSGALDLGIAFNTLSGVPGGVYSAQFLYMQGLQFGPGESYCFGDGSGSLCPCGNVGAAGRGCANSTGAGALLTASGTVSIAIDDLQFDVSGMPSGVSAILYEGSTTLGGGLGLTFKDGLKCAGGVSRRFPLQTSDAQGHLAWGPALAAQGAWSAGTTQYFQAWYRDAAGSPCAQFSNMSNAMRVTFVP